MGKTLLQQLKEKYKPEKKCKDPRDWIASEVSDKSLNEVIEWLHYADPVWFDKDETLIIKRLRKEAVIELEKRLNGDLIAENDFIKRLASLPDWRKSIIKRLLKEDIESLEFKLDGAVKEVEAAKNGKWNDFLKLSDMRDDIQIALREVKSKIERDLLATKEMELEDTFFYGMEKRDKQ